jgi:Na+/H+ antiporter NhaB
MPKRKTIEENSPFCVCLCVHCARVNRFIFIFLGCFVVVAVVCCIEVGQTETANPLYHNVSSTKSFKEYNRRHRNRL